MSEEEELKQKKMEEMKKQMEGQQRQMEAEMQLDSALKRALTDEARERLNNVKLVNRELYMKATQAIIYFLNNSRVQAKLSDSEVKMLLQKLTQKKEINIRRK
jgi:programmed cell death protein 5